MFPRLQQLSPKYSFFLFGPRGTGKSTLLQQRFDKNQCLWLDLLNTEVEDQFFRNPGQHYAIVKALPKEVVYIIIDEVHRLLEETDKIFILTGSSTRKLKHGGANLLAGRAFVYHLSVSR